MSTYVIGDIQGCHADLQRLLERLRFDPGRDSLWFTGDLVNRGPASLAVLRFVMGLGDRAVTVLGNHDLHLIAVSLGGRSRSKDTFGDVLEAPDRDALLGWLRARPLVHHDPSRGVLMVHAGLPPDWDAADAVALARETGLYIRSAEADTFLRKEMYGDGPRQWSQARTPQERHRFVINCLTRLRFCTADGRLDFSEKGSPGSAASGLVPWFSLPARRSLGTTILFGHWSTLGRVHWPQHGVYGLDTGCVWGRGLTALCLETGEITQERGFTR